MTAAANAPAARKETPKESVIGLIISFVVVLIFRGFFFETFHIPTGSMAPTLRGAHMQFTSPQSGFTWAVNPWSDPNLPPSRVQGTPAQPVRVTDPVSGVPMPPGAFPLRSGDRIAVLKYNWFHHPRRWDVIVFKMPENPRENYIKRLLGLPNEDLWLVDGDIFTRPAGGSDDLSTGWAIARKPRYIQDTLWWPLHGTEHTPLSRDFDGRAWRSPWRGEGWVHDGRTIRAESPNPGPLVWDNALRPIVEFSPYNETPMAGRMPVYPTSDIRVRAGMDPMGDPPSQVAFTIAARAHEFRALMDASGSRIQMRRQGEPDWRNLGEPGASVLHSRDTIQIEFQHVDQSLELRVNGRTIAHAAYDWSPVERLRNSTRLNVEQLDDVLRNPDIADLSNPAIYVQPRVSIEITPDRSASFTGLPVLHNAGIDRDLYYQPAVRWAGPGIATPGLGSHPGHLATMGDWQFFAAGDNSGNSRDSRLWDAVNPWIADQTGATPGIVPGDMLMGEAVIVFWPAPQVLNLGPVRLPFIPDLGRARLIK